MNLSNRNHRYRNRLLVSTAIAGATLLGFGQSAEAACVPVVSPNYVCSGANTTGQLVPTTVGLPLDLGDFIALALAPANPSVTTDPGFSVTTSDPYALGILGSGAVSYTDANASPLTSTTGIGLGVVSLVPQAADPYYGPNPGGAVAIDTSGAVTGALIGLAAINTGDGATTVKATGDVTATGANSYGLFAYSQGSVATVTTGMVSGKKSAIYAVNQGTTADLSIAANGDVIGGTLYGIYAINGGRQFDVVNTILNGTVTFVSGPPASAGKDLTVTANGKVDSGNTGIFVENYGTGATSITTKGAVTAAGLYGIYAFSGGTDLTIDAVAVSGVVYGIYADNKGTGSTSITAKAAVTGTNDTGIYAFNDDTTTAGLTVDAMAVSGGKYGIHAENRGAGATSVTAKGAVTGTDRVGIIAVNAALTFNPDGTFAGVANTNATDLTVDVIAVSGGKTGIYALNTGTGATSITAAGAVTGTDDFGINAVNSSTATGLTVNATAVSGGGTGIYARNYGTGATSITATGSVIGTDGDGINAHNDSTAKDLTVDAMSVSGDVMGIDVINYGTGATRVKATGTVTGTTNFGIYAINGSLTTGGLKVDAAAVSGSIYGIYTENSGGATTSITATGTVEGANAAIIAQSSVAQAISISLSGATRNSAQTATALAVLTVGGSTALTNDGTLTGRSTFVVWTIW
ncbi:hypothetical protein EN925_07905 [Mesorhizobium sp. M7A.F.Ca.US.006.04.2.1]|uniref:beta strand repeat-containing protein n=1 Tax=unclassified Mesorhizobium TaxID=325217 RepID=UPI000FCBE46A|nr:MULTISPECIES: hypothetical protein [unclassified Mesorhizobium]RUX70908.1 hypothetical protein EN990_30185 [Mesorhizobium sp. M7A.F.Ca.US.005.03.1.1]RUY16622.1 hypothetical protein EN991_10735 [Mesorhizobium sp. M7A.F.Ca.US.005.03.2.1]RUY28605.1 hypothetical protein EN979_12925 [Mesorhizobium sp. M7A.F.Ca.US.001.04.2.1]RUY35523.1 hypothetical protein EN978_31985 [Mesorhizobium sp. M7A.F.Ca.US.001.04.1.1]RVA02961.1 hypothetical protein EN938_17610 [Mesorhizobium sp. M7A.F.Ca.US.001.02.1.1]